MQNRFGRLEDLIPLFSKKSFYHSGFFAVKRRAVFILGAMWWPLVRGWRRDCVVGGMETRFQWRKMHSHTAKCEAFHIAPRLFFRFLFLFALSDNLISEDWFFAKRLFSLCFCFSPPSIYPLNTLIRGNGFRGGEGVKKAAWERGGFQAAAYLD